AREGKPVYPLPRAWLDRDSLDFSFSGLKTAVGTVIRQEEKVNPADVAASFQESVVEVLTEKAIAAVKKTGVSELVLAGGVSANSGLREALMKRCAEEGIRLRVPPPELCTDNAA